MNIKKRRRPLPVRFLSGVLSGIAVSVIVLTVCAVILTKKDVAQPRLPIMLLAACALGSVCCAFICAKQIDFRGIVTGIISAGILSVLYLIILFLCSGFSISGWMAAILAADLLLGAGAGIAAKNMR